MVADEGVVSLEGFGGEVILVRKKSYIVAAAFFFFLTSILLSDFHFQIPFILFGMTWCYSRPCCLICPVMNCNSKEKRSRPNVFRQCLLSQKYLKHEVFAQRPEALVQGKKKCEEVG